MSETSPLPSPTPSPLSPPLADADADANGRDTWIYLEEDLPEIEVLERVLFGKIKDARGVKIQPSFLEAAVLRELFQGLLIDASDARVRGFVELHGELLRTGGRPPAPAHATPPVAALARRRFAGNDDGLASWLEIREEATRPRDHRLAQRILDERLFPYVRTDPEPGAAPWTPALRTEVALSGPGDGTGVVLPDDSHVQLFATVSETSNVLDAAALERAISALPTEAELDAALAPFGWSTRTMDVERDALVSEHLTQVIPPEPPLKTWTRAVRANGAAPAVLSSGVDFFERNLVFFNRVAPVLEDFLKQAAGAYATFLQNQSIASSPLDTNAPFAHHLERLRSGEIAWPDFVEYVRGMQHQARLAAAAGTLQSLQKFMAGPVSKESMARRLREQREAHARTADSIAKPPKDDAVPYTDLQAWQRNEVVDAMEHAAEAPDAGVAETEAAGTGTGMGAGAGADGLEEFDPSPWMAAEGRWSSGQAELLNAVGVRLAAVARASGLDADWSALQIVLASGMDRPSRAEALAAATPAGQGRAWAVLLDDQVLAAAEALPGTDVRAVQLALESLVEDVDAATARALAAWTLQVHERIIDRTFQFDPWRAYPPAIDAWSPSGFPLTDERSAAREGVLAYLAIVANDVVGPPSGARGGKWIDRAVCVLKNEMGEVGNALRERWKASGPSQIPAEVVRRADNAKRHLNEAIETKNKARMLHEYKEFLKNLPSVLVQSSVAKHLGMGCCLQRVHAAFEPDSDWRAYKKVLQLKQLYAKQRLHAAPRPAMARILRQDNAAHAPHAVHAPMPEAPWAPDATFLASLEAWIHACPDAAAVHVLGSAVAAPTQLRTAIHEAWTVFGRAAGVSVDAVRAYWLTLEERTWALWEASDALNAIAAAHQRRATGEAPGSPAAREWATAAARVGQMRRWLEAWDGAWAESPLVARAHVYAIVRALCSPLTLEELRTRAGAMKAALQSNFKMLAAFTEVRRATQAFDPEAYIRQQRETKKRAILAAVDLLSDEGRELYRQTKGLGVFRLMAMDEETVAEAGAGELEEEGDDDGAAAEFLAMEGTDPDDMDADAIDG